MSDSAQTIHKNSSDEQRLPRRAVAPSSEEGAKSEDDQNADKGEGRAVFGCVSGVD